MVSCNAKDCIHYGGRNICGTEGIDISVKKVGDTFIAECLDFTPLTEEEYKQIIGKERDK